jgi:hypothetical protein
MNTPPKGVHETEYLVFMKPFVGGGDESTDSNATPKTTTAGPRGRQFRVDLELELMSGRGEFRARRRDFVTFGQAGRSGGGCDRGSTSSAQTPVRTLARWRR